MRRHDWTKVPGGRQERCTYCGAERSRENRLSRKSIGVVVIRMLYRVPGRERLQERLPECTQNREAAHGAV